MIAGEVVEFLLCNEMYLLPTGSEPANALLDAIRSAGDASNSNSNSGSTCAGGGGQQSGNDDGLTALFDHDPRVSVMVTNFRLVVTYLANKTVSPIQIPLMTVASCARGRKGPECSWLDVQTKHTCCLRIASWIEDNVVQLAQVLEKALPRSLSHLFAFAHFDALLATARVPGDGERSNVLLSCPTLRDDLARNGVDSGWGIFNIRHELARMTSIDSCAEVGLGQNITPWFQVLSIGQHDVFKTYPTEIIVPRRATLDVALGAAKYRQNARIPSISWVHLNTGASLSRSSQPRVGAGASSSSDQLLCSYLNQSLHAAAANANEPRPPATAQSAPNSLDTAMQAAVDGAAAAAAAADCRAPPSLLDHDRSASTAATTRPPPSLLDTASPKRTATAPTARAAVRTNTHHTPANTSAGSSNSCGGGEAQHVDPVSARAGLLRCEGRKLHIVDCRSKAAAAANMANGGGFELVQFYDRAQLSFMQLGNIHEVRGAFSKLTKLVNATHQPSTECPTQKAPSVGFMTALEETGWVRMTQRLLWAAWKVTNHLCDGDSVLVHCTDGWDRTAQVVSLAMLMLDARYRTVEGFCVLVEREWLQMGHRFADRCNHDRAHDDMLGGGGDDGGEGADPDAASSGGGGGASGSGGGGGGGGGASQHQSSPVFIQFIDCVYQLLRCFPDAFEFTPQFLALLCEAAYSCRFGTFLFNCHRSRFRRGGVVAKTASLWTEIEGLVGKERSGGVASLAASERLLSPFFNAARHATQAHTARRLQAPFHSARYCFWASWYFRHRTECLDSGLVGLEPDNLTPLIEVFLSMQPLRHRSSVANSVGGCGRTKGIAPSLAAERETGSRDAAGDTTSRHELFQHRVAFAALQSDWVVVQPLAPHSPVSPQSAAPGAAPSSAAAAAAAAAAAGGGGASESRFLPRSEANQCALCNFVFTFFSRRHTCRRCCRAVCDKCSPRAVVLPRAEIALYDDRNAPGPLRVCSECYVQVTRFNMDDDNDP